MLLVLTLACTGGPRSDTGTTDTGPVEVTADVYRMAEGCLASGVLLALDRRFWSEWDDPERRGVDTTTYVVSTAGDCVTISDTYADEPPLTTDDPAWQATAAQRDACQPYFEGVPGTEACP